MIEEFAVPLWVRLMARMTGRHLRRATGWPRRQPGDAHSSTEDGDVAGDGDVYAPLSANAAPAAQFPPTSGWTADAPNRPAIVRSAVDRPAAEGDGGPVEPVTAEPVLAAATMMGERALGLIAARVGGPAVVGLAATSVAASAAAAVSAAVPPLDGSPVDVAAAGLLSTIPSDVPVPPIPARSIANTVIETSAAAASSSSSSSSSATEPVPPAGPVAGATGPDPDLDPEEEAEPVVTADADRVGAAEVAAVAETAPVEDVTPADEPADVVVTSPAAETEAGEPPAMPDEPSSRLEPEVATPAEATLAPSSSPVDATPPDVGPDVNPDAANLDSPVSPGDVEHAAAVVEWADVPEPIAAGLPPDALATPSDEIPDGEIPDGEIPDGEGVASAERLTDAANGVDAVDAVDGSLATLSDDVTAGVAATGESTVSGSSTDTSAAAAANAEPPSLPSQNSTAVGAGDPLGSASAGPVPDFEPAPEAELQSPANEHSSVDEVALTADVTAVADDAREGHLERPSIAAMAAARIDVPRTPIPVRQAAAEEAEAAPVSEAEAELPEPAADARDDAVAPAAEQAAAADATVIDAVPSPVEPVPTPVGAAPVAAALAEVAVPSVAPTPPQPPVAPPTAVPTTPPATTPPAVAPAAATAGTATPPAAAAAAAKTAAASVLAPAVRDEFNRTNLDYRRPMPRPKVRGRVVDFHCHLFALRHAADWFEAADHYGMDVFLTMSPLEEATGLAREWGHRLRFNAVPSWGDASSQWVSNWLVRIESFYNLGSRIAKFHASPGTMAMRGVWLDHAAYKPIFAELKARGMGIMTHIGDPDTWYNGRYDPAKFGSRDDHYKMWEGLLDEHRGTPWVGAHLGGNPEDLPRLQRLLDRFPDLMLDCSATRWMVREVSARRDAAREFFVRNQDRILFGSDQVSGHDRHFDFLASRIWCHRKLWETAYTGPSPIIDPDLPRDQQPVVRGLALPDAVLQKIYHDNATRLLDKLGMGFDR